ncbi:LysM peptidoglycan-binding domain-containing protein [uncultured Lacinutrix sp.]|uniref:lytic transglycosylase n=1 Tax=uncultured Lacinutrix sp. TaxID=574032 RepID=UPI002617C3DB|nr:LysM peptidoglycan-binding domain-containing protein [uncultured Lacinutrix sp.]
MKTLVFSLFSLLSFAVFAQDDAAILEEEFIPIEVEGREAYMSTKTGEYTYLKHSETDETQLKTTSSGVVYTDISTHIIKKGETLSSIAKKNNVTIEEIKRYNKLSSSNLKVGAKVKIVKKTLVKSSSPVKGTSGEERIIARLRPGESPGALAPPPPMEVIEKKLIKTEKTRAQPIKATYKVENDIKNPVLGLGDNKVEEITNQTIEEPVKESKKEKLKRLKAEMKALEAELEAEPKQTVEKNAHDAHDGHDHSKSEKKEKLKKEQKEEKNVKTTEEVKIITEKHKEDSKEEIFDKVEIEEESLAAKASRIVKQVKETKKPSKTVTSDSEKKKEKEIFYTVKKGNSLWSIAKKHNMTVNALKKLNNLKNNNLDIGQKLKVLPKLNK